MKAFAVRRPILFELLLIVVAFLAALLVSLPGQLFGLSSDLAIALGRILVGLALMLIFRYCLRHGRPLSGVKYLLPCLAFVLWNLVYNPLSGSAFAPPTAETLLLGLAPAIFEEVLFRGIFIHNLRKNGKSPLVTVVISALVFGLVHLTNIVGMTPANVLVQTVYATVIGLALGAVYVKSGDLLSVILLHGMIDVSSRLFPESPETTSVPVLIGFGLLLLAEAAWALWSTARWQKNLA